MKLTGLRQMERCGHQSVRQWFWLCLAACAYFFVTEGAASTATASTRTMPAITEHVEQEMRLPNTNMKQAIFWTRASDGTVQFETRDVADDAITGFAQEYPAWHLDTTLSWFFRTPVYEREVPSQAASNDKDSV